jgi:hypothetical protein
MTQTQNLFLRINESGDMVGVLCAQLPDFSPHVLGRGSELLASCGSARGNNLDSSKSRFDFLLCLLWYDKQTASFTWRYSKHQRIYLAIEQSFNTFANIHEKHTASHNRCFLRQKKNQELSLHSD